MEWRKRKWEEGDYILQRFFSRNSEFQRFGVEWFVTKHGLASLPRAFLPLILNHAAKSFCCVAFAITLLLLIQSLISKESSCLALLKEYRVEMQAMFNKPILMLAFCDMYPFLWELSGLEVLHPIQWDGQWWWRWWWRRGKLNKNDDSERAACDLVAFYFAACR